MDPNQTIKASYFNELFSNIRFYILVLSALLMGGIYFWAKTTFQSSTLIVANLTQTYALTAVTYLYFTLLASPLVRLFPSLPFRAKYIQARRALGVSAFLFALMHACFAFFGELGGFEGLPFLNSTYLTAISLGVISLTILTIMASLSFDSMIDKIGYKKWKFLHRFVYLVALLITIHALMLGSAFIDLSGAIPQVFGVALAVLVLMEAIRLDRYLAKKSLNYPQVGLSLLTVILLLGIYYSASLLPTGITGQLSVHEAHKKALRELNQPSNSDLPDYLKNMPGMQGDKTKRFTVDFSYPDNIQPNTPTPFSFKVYDASTGNQISLFTKNYDKLIHMIIVDNGLGYYEHIHPEFNGSEFEVKTVFPKAGRYHIYLDFQPTGAIEQQFAFNIKVGEAEAEQSTQPVDQVLEKTFGNYNLSSPESSDGFIAKQYKVALSFEKPLKASRMSIGDQTLTFKVMDLNGNPITTLKPYLATFGHLVMIKQDSYDYLHVHPMVTKPVASNALGGPEVVFMPAGIYGPIKPGIYRVFGQFNPDGNLITADFTIKVE